MRINKVNSAQLTRVSPALTSACLGFSGVFFFLLGSGSFARFAEIRFAVGSCAFERVRSIAFANCARGENFKRRYISDFFFYGRRWEIRKFSRRGR